jgi:hypothetical protein
MGEKEAKEVDDHCLNCGADLGGEYCSQCGQRAGRQDLRFSDAMSELLGDLLEWDSRIWRTLVPLIFRPGYLTAEYMAGRRARYVAPLRLYLIISFILFLTLSVGNVVTVSTDGTIPDDVLDEIRQAPAGTVGGDIEDAIEESGARGVSISGSQEPGDIALDMADENSPQWLQRLEQRLEENAASVQEEPGAFVEELLESLPQMMFLLLPLFALLLKFSYLSSPFHYLQHLLFSLNYHSFAFLLYLLGGVIERLGMHFDGMLLLLLAIYLPVALWRAYGSSVMGAAGKALLIQISYALLLALAFALLAVVTFLLM